MAFAVICKSCQARFLLNDDLLRRKVAGKVVTVRCRQCHATIEVDASDVDPKSVPDAAPEPPPPPALGKIRAPRPAPAPPRPAAKSTLMGIGAPRAAGATELVALSPGFLDVKPAPPSPAGPQGFPEPPPPPGSVEVLDAGDWDEIPSTPSDAREEAVPESLDDFAEELPPSLPPEEEMPSSTGTPSLKALAHHEQTPKQPRVDDFLANMTAAMNGGTMPIAPTIDVSGLASAPVAEQQAPTIDVAELNAPKPTPLRDPVRGARTLPLFSTTDTEEAAPEPAAKAPKAPPKAAGAKAAKPDLATASPDGSLSPATIDPRPPESEKPADSPRERRNVVAPATKSVPPAAPAPKTSGLAAPLLLALAAAAGFFIWKRSASHATEPVARPEPAAERVAAMPPTPVATAVAAEPAAPAAPAPGDDMTFETAPDKPATPTGAVAAVKPASAPIAAAPADAPAKPVTEAPTPAAPKEEPKPEPAAPTPPAEPAGPFDRAAAAAALTSAASQASACRKEGDPSGVASVTITFAPSGRVTSANIGGPPFAGTPTGGCIASTLRKAKVPAFEGDRVTVSKTVVIQ